MTGIVNRVAANLGRGLGQSIDFLAGSNGGGFDVLSTLSTGLTLASAGATYFGARDRANAIQMDARQASVAAKFDAREADIEAQREALRGKQEANLIMDDLLQTIAAQRVGFAANGMDLTFGTPTAIETNTRALAGRKLDVAESDRTLNQTALRRQAAARRQESAALMARGTAEARNVRNAGTVGALGTVAGLIDRRIARG